ncbi:PREDICTED: anthocyanidin 5,3-O-glucosyltransferase-like [Populus euphratica]|uniref:anthocyanidin 3-O-glucosyltransferase n=1 Tax=Populus euphratica TaxID=75702 RepID=A0AAJ6YA18_POPEU|nr:PREDICTED: anthocyanidin 5,3-O-glucosyltransferase-like [Populus euphratica]
MAASAHVVHFQATKAFFLTGDKRTSRLKGKENSKGALAFLRFSECYLPERSFRLRETASGLEKSGVRFWWVVHPPLADSQTQAGKSSTPNEPCLELLLPEGFLERTKDRGFLVNSWAPQVEILNHGSVGGFVTHCGWNSFLEALCAGVPMVAWPLYAEQRMNRIFLVEEMKVALAFREAEDDQFVTAAELEERVIELVNSKKGEAIRDRVLKLRKDAVVAKSDGGSSCLAMAKLVDSFKKV